MPKNGVGIVNLATGQATTVAEHVKSFRVPDDTPKIVVYLTVAAETGAGTGANGARGIAEDARKETIRHRPGDSRSLVGRTDDGRGSQRLRAEQGRRLAGLRRVVEDGGQGRRVRPQHAERGDPESPDWPRQLQGVCVRRRRPAGRVRQRSRRLHVTRAALQALSLDVFSRLGGRTADPGRRIDDCQRERPSRVFERRRPALLRHGRAARGRTGRRIDRHDQSRHLELQGRRNPADAEGAGRPGKEAHLPRGLSSGRQTLRAAGDARHARRSNQREQHVRPRRQQRAVSPAGVVGRQLRRLLPGEARATDRVRRFWRRSTSAPRCRPAETTSSTSTKTTTTGTRCASATA